jgi:hypothetical protein
LLAVRLAPIGRQNGPVPAVEMVPENLVLDNFASRIFPLFARPILALDRVGGARGRAGGLWAFAVCLVIGVIASLPLLGLARVLLGGWMQAAVERYERRLGAAARDGGSPAMRLGGTRI